MPHANIEHALQLAIHNNARWCDAMCRAHGVPGEFRPTAWINRHRVPPFHSNVITLADQQSEREQRDAIESLLSADPCACDGVKDSFACLDLRDLAFEPLFDAAWIWRPPHAATREQPDERLAWSRIVNPSGLDAWERAWRADELNTAPPARMFLPSLLADPTVAFLAGTRDGAIAAVAIAHRTGDAVGLSNVFAPDPTQRDHWVGCVRAITELFPQLPIVGYERGQDLADAQRVGFEPIHPLRVWVRSS